MSFLPQSTYDAKEHDAKFPQHPLSVVRAAVREVLEATDLQIAAPAMPQLREPVILPALGCALLPPPRFVLAHSSADAAVFRRVAFCGTDGLESFVVEPVRQSVGNAIDICEEGARRARARHEADGITDLRVRTERIGDAAVVVVDGNGHLGARRSVMRWFVDGVGDLWSTAIVGSAAVPSTDHEGALAAVATSWSRRAAPVRVGFWRRLFGA